MKKTQYERVMEFCELFFGRCPNGISLEKNTAHFIMENKEYWMRFKRGVLEWHPCMFDENGVGIYAKGDDKMRQGKCKCGHEKIIHSKEKGQCFHWPTGHGMCSCQKFTPAKKGKGK